MQSSMQSSGDAAIEDFTPAAVAVSQRWEGYLGWKWERTPDRLRYCHVGNDPEGKKRTRWTLCVDFEASNCNARWFLAQVKQKLVNLERRDEKFRMLTWVELPVLEHEQTNHQSFEEPELEETATKREVSNYWGRACSIYMANASRRLRQHAAEAMLLAGQAVGAYPAKLAEVKRLVRQQRRSDAPSGSAVSTQASREQDAAVDIWNAYEQGRARGVQEGIQQERARQEAAVRTAVACSAGPSPPDKDEQDAAKSARASITVDLTSSPAHESGEDSEMAIVDEVQHKLNVQPHPTSSKLTSPRQTQTSLSVEVPARQSQVQAQKKRAGEGSDSEHEEKRARHCAYVEDEAKSDREDEDSESLPSLSSLTRGAWRRKYKTPNEHDKSRKSGKSQPGPPTSPFSDMERGSDSEEGGHRIVYSEEEDKDGSDDESDSGSNDDSDASSLAKGSKRTKSSARRSNGSTSSAHAMIPGSEGLVDTGPWSGAHSAARGVQEYRQRRAKLDHLHHNLEDSLAERGIHRPKKSIADKVLREKFLPKQAEAKGLRSLGT